MLALSVAGILLCASCVLMFGMPFVVRGRYALEDLPERTDLHALAGLAVIALATLVMTPLMNDGLISGGEQVLKTANYVFTGLYWSI